MITIFERNNKRKGEINDQLTKNLERSFMVYSHLLIASHNIVSFEKGKHCRFLQFFYKA